MAEKIIRSWDAIHPIALPLFCKLAALLDDSDAVVRFTVFETYRSPQRQNELYSKKKTRAKAWQSAHQFGLAMDVVPLNGLGQPYWPEPSSPMWDVLQAKAEELGLCADLPGDRCHVYHPSWLDVRRAL